MTATIVPHDPNMDHLMNDRVERRIWGPSSYVPGQGNRRMAAIGYSDHYGHVVSQGERNEYGIRTWDYTMH